MNDIKLKNDLEIINKGRNDILNPMSEREMNFLFGGINEPDDLVICKKGYTRVQCLCGYSGPAL